MPKIFCALSLAIMFSPAAYSHSGHTNEEGCHYDRNGGGYHCHDIPEQPPISYVASPEHAVKPEPTLKESKVSADDQPATTDAVKKSRRGICHAPGTSFYSRTTNFTPYKSLEDCIASGGHSPAR